MWGNVSSQSVTLNDDNISWPTIYKQTDGAGELQEGMGQIVRYYKEQGQGALLFIGHLRNLVVRALERYSNDPGSSPAGDACFSH